LIYYGAKANQIFRYRFTSIKQNDLLSVVLSRQEKSKIKDKLGIKYEKVLLSIGQFIHRKGFDVLLKACKNIDCNVGVYIIGGDPTDEYIQLKKELALNNVHFINFKTKEEIKEYYKAADVFVLPTRQDIWGLVVNEAMANALPVITTDKCVAGLELIKDNDNGFIVPADNFKLLAERINIILSSEELCNEMAQNSLNKIKKYTIENMASRHRDIFNDILHE